MRKVFIAVAVCLAVACALVAGSAGESRAQSNAQCTTQGAFALALAQVLKFEVTTVEAAVSALSGIGVMPDGGWRAEECLTDAVSAQVRLALDQAMASGAVPPSVGTGAVAGTLEALRSSDRLYPTTVSPSRP